MNSCCWEASQVNAIARWHHCEPNTQLPIGESNSDGVGAGGWGRRRCRVCYTGCGVDCEHAAAAAVGHVPHVVRSRFAFRCCRSSFVVRDCDMIIDTISVELAMRYWTQIWPGTWSSLVARRTMGAQVPGTRYLVRAPASSSLHSATAIAAILAEFCILHVEHVKRVDFWLRRCPGNNWRAMLARKVQFNVSKIYRWPPRGMRSVPNLGKRQKWQHKQKPKERKTS